MHWGLNMNNLEVPNGVVTQNADDLTRCVRKALREIEEILDIDINTVKPLDQLKMLSVKKDAASAIINAGLKADENRFRRENTDIIERLFTKIKKDSRIIDGEVVHRI